MKVILITFATLCLWTIVSCVTTVPPPKYEGPQTVEALLETYSEKVANPEIDEKYPQAEWLQMLLDKGITIEDFGDYSGYMTSRWNLAQLEYQPEKWASGKLGIPPTDDWKTYKTAYIERQIWEYQQLKAAQQMDPTVDGGVFTGPNQETFLPTTPGCVYVQRSRGGGAFSGEPLSEKQKFNILFKGKHPWGRKIIYIDEIGNILPKKPAPISPEDLGLPADVSWPPKDQKHLDRIYEEVKLRYQLEKNR